MEKLYAFSLMKRVPGIIGLFALAQVFAYQVHGQQFTAGRLVVERVGAGAVQTNAGTPIFLDEYTTTGVLGISLPLPTVTTGSVNRTVESGTATSDGMLSRSQDGKFLAVPGYDAAPGTAGIVSSSANRVITRVDGNGNLASTVVTNASAFPGNNFRSVATYDGSEYWLSGAGNGPVYVTHTGSTSPVAGVEVSTTSTDNRNIYVSNGQLYAGTAVGTVTGVYSVGTGLPTTPGSAMTVDESLGAGGDPYDFVILNNGGVSVMYVTDFLNKKVYKSFYNGAAWIPAGAASITVAGTATGFYGITGNVVGTTSHLYATATNGSGTNSSIVSFTDPTTPTTTLSSPIAATTIVTASSNLAFHGITFVPFSVTGIASTLPIVCSGSGTTVTISGNPNTSVTYMVGGVTQPPVTITSTGTYSFATGPLTANTTYSVVSATDGSVTQPYGFNVTVSVNPLPSVSAGSAAAICNGASTGLTASGTLSYTWAPAAGLSATTGAGVTASPFTTTTFTVTGTDINGCTNRANVTVTINPLPVIGAGPGVSVCTGLSASLTASGGVSYTWAPATGLSATTGATVTAGPASNTTYTITGANGNGCVNSGTVTVTVNPLPTVSGGPGATFCTGASAVLIASGASTYGWSPAFGLTTTIGSTVTSYATTTTTYTVTGTDVHGCVNKATVTVSVNPLPSVTVTAGGAICAGGSIGLLAGGALTYSWSPATALSATTGSSVAAGPASSTTYSITGTDLNGCINHTTVTVTVNPLPIVHTGTPVAICFGAVTGLAASGAISYTWSPASGLSATTGSSVLASPSSTTTYTITGTNGNGCVNTTTNTVTVNMLPVVVATPDVTICQGTSTGLAAIGATSYTWLPAAGLSAVTGNMVIAHPSATTTYTVTGFNGCAASATVTVSVNPLPVVSAGPGVTLCIGYSTPLAATGAASYTWSPAAGLASTIGASVSASPTVTTTYTVTGTDGNGCVNNSSVTVTVYSLPIVSCPGAGICPGSTTALGAVGALTYTWSPSSGLSSTAGNIVIANPASTTTYTITGTDYHGCYSTALTTVTVYALPAMSVPGAAICNGSSAVLTATGAATYTWVPGYGLSVTSGSTVIASPAVTTTYTVTGIYYCSNSTTVTVTVNPLPAVVVPGATICAGSTAGLLASGASTYIWSPAAGLSATTGSLVMASPAANTVYTITGTDIHGCVKSVTSTVLLNLLPPVSAGPPRAVCTGSSVTLTGAGAGAGTYVWSPGTGLSATTGSTVSAAPATTTIYTVTGTNSVGCVNRAIVPVSVNPLPYQFTVTGGGTFCAGGSGVPVGLVGSQGGVTYYLYKNSLNTGISLLGVGSSLDFGHPSYGGYYTVVGVFPTTGCADTMSGGAGITILPSPAPVAVLGGGAFCTGGTGVHVGLAGSGIGTDYQLYRNGSLLGGVTPGVGGALDFGIQTIPGVYTATAVFHGQTCISNMTGSATVSLLPNPGIFNVTGGGVYCEGDPGVHIGINGSEIGERYGVYMAGFPYSSSKIGLNTPLDFGLFTTPGTYYIVASSSTTGCTDTMAGTVTVSINPKPVITGPAFIPHNTTVTYTATPSGGAWTSQYTVIATVGAATGAVTGVSLGGDEITYTLPTGCYGTKYITVAFNVDVPSVSALNNISLTPNPNKGMFTLSGTFEDPSDKEVTIEISNLLGQVVYTNKVPVNGGNLNQKMELANAAPGMYILTLKTAEEKAVVRFVVE